MTDERGIIVGWLIKLIIGFAVVGLIVYDGGAIAVNYFTLDSTADDIAIAVSSGAKEVNTSAGPVICSDRRGLSSQAGAGWCQQAKALAAEAGARLVKATVDAAGIVSVSLKRSAKTLVIKRVGAVERWGVASATGQANIR